MTKLIIVEGLPGSGKSTVAQIVYDNLLTRKVNVELFSEGNYNHPADFDGVAYFNKDEFQVLEEKHRTSEEILERFSKEYLDGVLIPFRKIIEEENISFEEELLNDIVKNDIYELPLGIHVKLIHNRWEEFVNNCSDDKVIIFECCFIQNPITVTMIRDGAKYETTKEYINNLAKLIESLDPLLIYVDQDNIDESFKRVLGERPKEWFEGFMYYYTNQGYGLKNNFLGLEGTIKILEERNKREKQIYDNLKINKCKVNNTKFNRQFLEENIQLILNEYI